VWAERVHVTGLERASCLRDVFFEAPEANDLAALAACRELSRLELRDLPRGVDLAPFARLTELRSLQVSGARRAKGWAFLRELTRLRYLTLQQVDGLGDLAWLAALQELYWLNVTDCGELTSLAPVATSPCLRILIVDGTTTIADGDLTPARSPSLHRVSIRAHRK
jgi:hypothetical protein